MLVDYFRGRLDDLSSDSRARLDRNPLRILDSKDEGDRRVVADAPVFGDYLSNDGKAFFDAVRAGLDTLDIAYELNPRLVRGLDYYTHTAFEFTTTELGAQGTVMAGGRYDGLIKMMGGSDTPGVGWAAGIERLAMLCDGAVAAPAPISLVPIGDAAEKEAFVLAERLRAEGLRVDLAYSGNVGRRMKRANRIGAAVAVVIGDDELSRGSATVRDMESGDQEEVAFGSLTEYLAPYR